ncbi:glycoside hydrolase family 43 protein [Cellvibrio japonicus]|uniref:Beta-xylosidase/alpha-L-arabinfuranosidase, putative, gly43I n=1 Tax=Cellvibrio japonicus (strain Ueda107) TaxID=498211 RepID=B3PH06_CELJU|nr:glycoside hydrolase 43 family protein [Cellvibrio japonicus]ACE86277.1 beta-xylosidase/alpha-L-arabinfuranosidase, putative, gly43I [Cellvibrio japonicus Ueda107]QEI13804.1 glycosyl hydrolase 43 family protein [Cellvibrio japonicus]QEI17378.1 glycosyl hydrolase 43 family protein [Cellvibrio japonicus]QEI20954.1 glycosyl hydrolase 43 family protein [Cellvibrio japonicus]
MFKPVSIRRLLIAAQGVVIALGLGACIHQPVQQQQPWVADLGNGDYQNPVLHADYSDPDVIRVGDTYYMTASSFNSAPGLPLLTSKDMVNWELVGHAFQQQSPLAVHARPQHGGGVWAPSLRYHNNMFWIFYGDPDVGIYMYQAKHFAGPWSKPHLLLPGKGLIDPTPFWDEDGNAYLLHAWAHSRAGISNKLTLRRMSPDGRRILNQEAPIVVNADLLPEYRALEGPKLYKRNGYYYIFAPAGGVAPGWQSVFRAKQIYGPYEDRIVLEQGNTDVNGPHQGAWVQTPEGTDWFFHFQDKGVYGRILHLQPMRWENDWPLIGQNINTQGVGEPVARHRKPVQGFPQQVPATRDEFDTPELGLQWQWNANWKPEWYSLSANPGYLRLYSQYDALSTQKNSLWPTPSLLLQKIPAPEFSVTTQITLNATHTGDRVGLIAYGFHYGWIGLRREGGHTQLVYATCYDAASDRTERIRFRKTLDTNSIYLRMDMREEGKAEFFYSLDGKHYERVSGLFRADRGRWVGGKIGLFSAGAQASKGKSYADVAYFQVTPLVK